VFDDTLSADPTNKGGYNADIYFNKGYALNSLGRHMEAIDAYDKAILLEPNDADAYKYKGEVFANRGMLDEAQKLYDKAVEVYSQSNKTDTDLSKKENLRITDLEKEISTFQ
jgi:tetratricopeptide (TPR) repeat protein